MGRGGGMVAIMQAPLLVGKQCMEKAVAKI